MHLQQHLWLLVSIVTNETNIKSGTGKVIPDLYIDDITKAANADDSNGQYFSIDNYFKANDRAYFKNDHL